MNGLPLAIGLGLCCAINSLCIAAAPVAQGTIEFIGSIVEPNCVLQPSERANFELKGCTSPVSIPSISVNRIDAANPVSASDHAVLNAKLTAVKESGAPHYLRQYQLVDDKSSPIRSGMYLITLTTP